MELNNGSISTGLISALVIIFGAIIQTLINNPAILQNLMGNYYIAYGALILAVLAALYEILFPRNKNVEKTE